MQQRDKNTTVSRRAYLAATGGASAWMVGLAGCASLSQATGTLATHVTDQPGDIEDFESCVVTIEGMWLGPSADDGDEDGDNGDEDQTETEDGESNEDGESDEDESSGREYHEYDEPQEADLVELQDGETQLVDEREIDVAEYRFLQLDVGAVDATLDDGSEATVEVPGNAPLKFNQSFEIREDTRTTFTADFTPVQRGGTGEYGLQPVADGTSVSYEDTGE